MTFSCYQLNQIMIRSGHSVMKGVIVLWFMLRTVYGQSVSGCPLFGCTPDGSFSLSSVITSPDVHIAWTAEVDNTTKQSNSQYGCVSNGNNIVCPTINGYVSLDPNNGTERWRTSILDRPTLPIMDIRGNVIGCDGKSLIKINFDGTLEPIIRLDYLDSIYSLNLMVESNAVIIVSRNGFVVGYLTNGIPLASLQLTGVVDGNKGIFHPIAAPVLSGTRVYVLTQFLPLNTTKQFPAVIRMYAIDLIRRMVSIISVAWYIDSNPTSNVTSSSRRQASMLVTGDKILASISTSSNSTKSSPINHDMFWSVTDKGTSAEFVYQLTSSFQKLCLVKNNMNNLKFRAGWSGIPRPIDLLWATSSLKNSEIVGIKWQNGTMVTKVAIDTLFGPNTTVSTNIMAGNKGPNVILVFGIQTMVSARISLNYVTAVAIGNDNYKAAILWKILISDSFQISGQLINFVDNSVSPETIRLGIMTTSKYGPQLVCLQESKK